MSNLEVEKGPAVTTGPKIPNTSNGEGTPTPKPMQAKSIAKQVEDLKAKAEPAANILGGKVEPSPVLISPFNTDLFRIDPKQNTIGISREILSIPVRGPTKFEHVRVHPNLYVNVNVIQLKDSRETYLVVPDMQGILARWLVPTTLYLAITSQGAPLIWSIRLPKEDEKDHPAWSTSRMIAHDAMTKWLMCMWNKGLNSYEKGWGDVEFAEPVWPAFVQDANAQDQILEKGFRDFVIRDMKHQLVKDLGFRTPSLDDGQ